VVVGDVNGGAEVIASGNIIVLGILRGMVYAGANSNNDAFIAGLSIKPTQIRIGEVIGTPISIENMKGLNPEMVAVKDGTLKINRLRTE